MSGSSSFAPFAPTVQPADPLATVGKYAVLSNTLAQNKLLQGAQITQQQQQAITGLDAMQDQLAALSANPNTTQQDIVHRAQMLEAVGVVPPGFTDKIIPSIPTSQAAIPQYLAQMRANIAAHRGSLQEQLYGAPVSVNTGPQTILGTRGTDPGMPGYGFQKSPGGTLQNDLSPAEAVAPQQIPAMGPDGKPTGATEVVPTSELQRRARAGGGAMPPGLRTGNPNVLLGPMMPTPGGETPAPAPAPAAAPAAPTGTSYGTTLAPGEAAPMAAAGEQLAAARTAMGSYAARTKPLEYAISHLANADTGRGTEFVNDVKGYVQSLAPGVAAKLGIDPQKITDYDGAVKYMAQVAANQPGAQSSDMGRQMASIANASGHIDKTAAQQVLFNALGMERMQHAMTLEYGNGNAQNFPAQVAKWNTLYDPRAFVFDKIDDKQKTQTLDSLKTPQDKNKFTEGLRKASSLLNLEMGLPK